jgi:hypothetical protein
MIISLIDGLFGGLRTPRYCTPRFAYRRSLDTDKYLHSHKPGSTAPQNRLISFHYLLVCRWLLCVAIFHDIAVFTGDLPRCDHSLPIGHSFCAVLSMRSQPLHLHNPVRNPEVRLESRYMFPTKSNISFFCHITQDTCGYYRYLEQVSESNGANVHISTPSSIGCSYKLNRASLQYLGSTKKVYRRGD